MYIILIKFGSRKTDAFFLVVLRFSRSSEPCERDKRVQHVPTVLPEKREIETGLTIF